MSNEVQQQIHAIHTMLSVGHRNLKMESHSLLLWGLAGGLLFALSDLILTEAQIPKAENRAVAWLALLTLVFGSVGIADWYFTKKAKAAREEVWSFIHRQIMKIWWLLIAIGSLLTFGMFFFGGGYMVCSAWIVLIGLGLFIHGLFSDEVLEWAGGSIVLVGILSLSFNFPYQSMKWIAASIFGVGMPLLTLMINRQQSSLVKIVYLLAWLMVVVVPPLTIQRLISSDAPNASTIGLSAYLTKIQPDSTLIVAIPEGTTIPVDIAIGGDVFRNNQHLRLPLQLAKPIEIVMVNGKPTRQVRFAGNDWKYSNEAGWLRIPWIHAEIDPKSGPILSTSLIVNLQRP